MTALGTNKTAENGTSIRLFYSLVPKRASAVWGWVYAFFIALATLYSWFKLISFPWFIVQASYAAIGAMSVVWLLVSGEISRVKPCLQMMLLQMAPMIFALVWSFPLYILHHESTSVMVRGVSAIFYQFLLLMMLHFAGMIFGSKVIKYTIIGFLIGNALIFFDVMRRYGPANTVTSLVNFVLHGTESGAFSDLEVQDLTFAFGVVAIYLISYSKDKKRFLTLLLVMFFFFVGWKRSALVGIAMGCGYTWFMERCQEKTQMRLSTLIGMTLVLVGFTYVVLIRSGLLETLADTFGINLMGRNKIYRLVLPYYQISPFHMGIGYMKVSTITERLYERAIRGLHSDILRMYVELGFPGFFIWGALSFVFTYRILAKRFSYRAARAYTAAALYVYLTYLTDNTATFYHIQIAWHVMPVAIFLEEMEGDLEAALRRKEQATLWKSRISASGKGLNKIDLKSRDRKNQELLKKLKKL